MADDYPNNAGTNGFVSYNGAGINGNMETVGDVDWFGFNQSFPNRFVLTNAQFQNVRIEIMRFDGVAVASYYGPATGAHLDFTVPSTPSFPGAQYFVSVQGYTSAGLPTTGAYTLSAGPVSDDHPDTHIGATSGVNIDGPAATGVINFNGDWDTFHINAMTSEQVRVDVTSAEFAYVIIRALGETGNIVASYSGLTSGSANFIAPASARYVTIIGFDAVGNYTTGAYSFTISSIPDDHGDTLATATPITLGETVNGVFEPGGDTDWFAITLTAGQPLLVTLPDSVSEVRFYLANGNETEPDILPTRQNGQLTQGFVADTDGVYYVRVVGVSGSYTLNTSISPYNPHDPVNYPTVPANGYLTGYLSDPTDVAWYRVDVAAGQTVSIREDSAFQFVHATFYDTQGNEIIPAGGGAVRYITATEASTYYIALRSNGGSYSLQSIVGADDFADGLNVHGSNVEPMGVLVANGPAVLFSPNHVGDVDYFAISLTAGQSIQILGPWWLGIGSSAGGILFYDSAGNPVEADFFRQISGSMSGDTQSAGMTATTTGTYYVALASGGPSNMTFPVQAVTLTSPHPMDLSTVPGLTDGQFVPDGAGTGWFAVHLEAGQTFRIEGEGALYDAYGNRVQVQAVVNVTQQFEDYFTVASTGTYYLNVYSTPGESNAFTAHIFFDDAPDWSPSTPLITHESYPVLDITGDQFNGRIEVYDDRDFFAFTLAAGETVRLHLEFTDPQSSSSPLTIYGSNGQMFVGQLESLDGSEIFFTAPSAGTYYLEVEGLIRYIGNYTLTLTPALPSEVYTGEPSIMPAVPSRPAIAPNSTTVTWYNGGVYTVTADTVLYGVNVRHPDIWAPFGSPVIAVSGASGSTLNNAGTIYAYGDEYLPFGVPAAYAQLLINTGTIVSENAFAHRGPGTINQFSIAVYVGGRFPAELALQNSGSIIALAVQSNAVGVIGGMQPTLENSGLIAAHATWSPNDPTQTGGASGISLGNGGTIINQVGGRIIAQGDSYANGVSVSDWGLTLTNYGLIEAQTTGVYGSSRAVSVEPLPGTSTAGGIVYNYGTLRGDYSLYGNLNLNNYAGGIVDGDITLFHVPNGINNGNHTINNQGTIIGHVDMGDGNDVFATSGAGRLIGSVDLSYGRDTYVGGDQSDAVVGGHGDDSLAGNGGQDLLLGSYGDDTLSGGAGNDGLYGEIGDDLLITAGGDVASGGAGNDRFQTGDYSFASISGDAGFDTWILPSGARTADLALVAASGRVSTIEAIQLAGAQTLVIHAADVAALTGATSLYVSGAATNNVYLAGAWMAGAQLVRDGVTYVAYTAGGATVYVQSGVAATVGSLPPTGVGLDAIGAGGPAPLPGSVEGADLSPVIITDFHRIIDQFVVGPGEVWQNLNGGIVFSAGELFGPTLTNYGQILSSGSLNPHVLNAWGAGSLGSATGIYGLLIDDFTNYGSVVATAILDGLATGFVGTVSDGFVNGSTGIIQAYAVNGTAIAYDGFDGSIFWEEWAVENRGDIYAFSLNGFAIGLSEHNGSSILNDGVIEANGGSGAIAVDLSNAGDGVWNRGQIIAYAPATSTYVSIGIFSDGSTQIINDGLIAAEIAILMRSRYQEDVTVTNTGTIIGDIEHIQPSSIALGAATINNSGDIFGNIYLSEALDSNSVTNAGYIEGDIFLGHGADTYQGGGELRGVVFAGDGADTLQGGAFSDIFSGDAGNDTMNGGRGVDVAIYSAASTAASWHRNPNGSWTVTAGVDGVDTLTSMEVLSFSNRNVVLDNAFRTFAGDGTSELLWRNVNTGAVSIWEMSGATQANAYIAGGAPNTWAILGTGDFSGDGRDDIIWRNTTTTAVAVWANGSGTAASIITGVPGNWQFQGIGDFNFDGRDDFVWRNANDGAVAVWLMNGNTIANQAIVSAAPAAWAIAGIADFDGDGRDDILLRNADGTVARWTTDGVTQTGAAIIGSAPTNWQIQGVGDFDGDGRADILFRNTNDGGLAMWRMDGNATLGVQMVGGAPLSWSIANVGDYNGDGRDDILWRNTDGTVALWTMNGFIVQDQAIVANVPTEWGLI
ncbi:MAG: FG-GAP-like repeat-containing protein [Alphaproteobacteria bacterium]|nr:FG-GAP-like repeat-containing protein [Alphaproteobacteria bacterium]